MSKLSGKAVVGKSKAKKAVPAPAPAPAPSKKASNTVKANHAAPAKAALIDSKEEEEEQDDEDDEMEGLVGDDDDDDDDDDDAFEDIDDTQELADQTAADEHDDDDEEDGDVELEELDGEAAAALPEEIRGMRINKVKKNNQEALRRVLDEVRSSVGASGSSAAGSKGKAKMAKLPWIETMTVVWNKSVEEEVGEDGKDDDLRRELAFYQQALHGAVEGRKLVEASGTPFSRPTDYFAEMVKTDAHMERVRQRLLDERAGIKASEDAKRQRELKKFGKKVQVEKLLERQRSKRQMEEKIKGLKRKRSGIDEEGAGATQSAFGDDDFDVRLEQALESNSKDNKRARTDERGGSGRGGRGGRGGGGKMPRSARDSKFGYGGKKRHAKENTAESSADIYGGGGRGRGRGRGAGGGGGRGRGGGRGAGFSAGRGRGGGGGGGAKRGGNRPGKARRADARK
ncbi:rRNA-processing protein EBP2 [Tilletia horrida]|uniref:rRNA-processing protein EBP2 n=1 Tax=Tilletia horrida TaxID=155126 RepID=A0AAN6JP47_9BASI|nr:rRNA-processing protein EBP2 [Tilletia horrida]